MSVPLIGTISLPKVEILWLKRCKASKRFPPIGSINIPKDYKGHIGMPKVQ